MTATRRQNTRRASVKPVASERLDRGKVIEATLRLVERHGVARLTMRLLAEELGCSTMATYRHVANKEELLALAADTVLGRIEVPPADSGAPQERVREIGRSAYTELAAHPWVAPFMISHWRTTRNAERVRDELIAIVSEVESDRSRSRQAAAAIRAYLIGWLAGANFDRPDGSLGRRRPSATARAHFEFGLDALIVGLIGR